MRSLLAAAVLPLAVSVSFAAGVPTLGISGNYIEARTADVFTGPCFANGEVEINGKEAVMGWKINAGSWHGVDIQGLSVVAVIRTVHTLGDVYQPVNPARAVLIIDQRADAEQRLALRSFVEHVAGEWLTDVVKVSYAPIDLTIRNGNIHSGVAKLTAGRLASIETRSLADADHICGNEDVYYPPLTELEHSMPAYAVADSYSGDGLGETWSSPYHRSSFLGVFQTASE